MRKGFALFGGAVLALALAVSMPMAGEGKCSHDAQACLDYMAKNMADRGWAGVQLEETDGALTVTAVHAGTPAERAGVKVGDQLVAINGIRLGHDNEQAAQKLWSEMKPGKSFDYTVLRRGKEKDINLTLEKMPQAEIAKMVGMHMIQGHSTVEVAQN